jgi:hypothetical protein
MSWPPFKGAIQVAVTAPEALVTVGRPGVEGTPTGVAGEKETGALRPFEFLARIVKMDWIPLVRPEATKELAVEEREVTTLFGLTI